MSTNSDLTSSADRPCAVDGCGTIITRGTHCYLHLEEAARAATDEQIRVLGKRTAAARAAYDAEHPPEAPDAALTEFFRATLADIVEIVESSLKRGMPWEYITGRVFQKAASTLALLDGMLGSEPEEPPPAPTE